MTAEDTERGDERSSPAVAWQARTSRRAEQGGPDVAGRQRSILAGGGREGAEAEGTGQRRRRPAGGGPDGAGSGTAAGGANPSSQGSIVSSQLH